MTKLAQSFGWEVTENEIIVGKQFGLVGPNKAPAIVSDRKAIVNGSTGDVLNTPKLGYTPLPNAQLEEAAHMMAKASGGTVEGFETFKGGNRDR